MKKATAVLLAILCLTLCGCSGAAENAASVSTAEISTVEESSAEIKSDITEDTKFGGATVGLSPEEFEAAGFRLGDSCDIEFGCGLTLTDVPYYNGFYIKNGEPVVVAYPGRTNVDITYNNIGIWNTEGLQEGDTVVIRLHEAGKYADTQEALGQSYSCDRAAYESDEQFCNFRELSGGNIRKGFFYRGASPVDNSRGRAAYTDGLLSAAGIGFIVDLADSEEEIDAYIVSEDFNSPYAAELFEKGNAVTLDMGSDYQSDVYRAKLVSGLMSMLDSETPVYIHCLEGKDRTGFVCFLLESLAGASYDEMRTDYMMTYKNYYKISLEDTPEKYNAVAELYFDSFAACLHGTDDADELKNADYADDAAAYLRAGGMSDDDIKALIEFIVE